MTDSMFTLWSHLDPGRDSVEEILSYRRKEIHCPMYDSQKSRDNFCRVNDGLIYIPFLRSRREFPRNL